MAGISKEWRKIVNSAYAEAGARVVTIEQVMADLVSTLQTTISGSNMPQGAKEAIINGISWGISSDHTGHVSIMAPRISIYGNIGMAGGVVNLAALFEYGWQIGHDAWFYGRLPWAKQRVAINLRTAGGFSGHAATNFAHHAASIVMRKYPECYISVS